MRVYVAWFLIVGGITLLLIGIKTYYNKFKLTKNIFIVFTIMFLGLNYVNIDYRIAKYDADLYIIGNVNTVNAFWELSDSALEPLLKISEINEYETRDLLEEYKNRLDEKLNWEEWNVANHNAREILKNR